MPRLVTAVILAAVLLGGCGSAATGGPSGANATLVLDFTPNAVHAGIYTAIARGYDRDSGVHLHVVVPSGSTDPIKLLQTGRVNFAVLDLHDLAIARERGADITGIMALVQRPLAAVIAAPEITSPRSLSGRTVGVTGLPSDTAVLRSIVSGAGGAPVGLHTITIGFDAVPDLLAGRVAAATAFWNVEGVTVRRRRPGFHVFRVDRYGAPSYPELVLCATGPSVRGDPGLASSVVHALIRGYAETLRHPQLAEQALEAQAPGLDPSLLNAELRALLPAFALPGEPFGVLSSARLRAWAGWETRFGIVARAPDPAAMFDTRFVPGQPRLSAPAKP